jgi:lysophospholipase L1-like esterase
MKLPKAFKGPPASRRFPRGFALLSGSMRRGHGSALSQLSVTPHNKTNADHGVQTGSTITVYKNGTIAGTATADRSGACAYPFSPAPAQGSVISYDGVIAGPSLVVGAIFVDPNLLPLDARFVAEGDSITAGSNGPTWLWAFNVKTNGRFYMPLNYNQATGGQTAAQMATQVAQITALSPKIVSLLAGTNDLGGTTDTPATIYNNLKTCWKAYIDGGAKHVIAVCVLPRNDVAITTARNADRVTLNGLIKAKDSDATLAGYADKIHVVDLESVFVPATDCIEGLHPNWLGAIKLGNAIASVFNTIEQQDTALNDLFADASNLLSSRNALMTGTTGSKSGIVTPTGQVADLWSVAENGGMTVTCSKSTLNGAAAQRIVVSGTNSTVQRLVNLSVGFNFAGQIGDQFEACIDFSLAAGHAKIRDIVVNHNTAATPNNGNQSFNLDGAGAISGTIRTAPTGPLTSTVTSITLQAIVNFDVGAVSADITWGRPYIRKVPTTN